MSPGRDPWSDPGTETEDGAPYAGPPVTGPTAAHSTAPGYGRPGPSGTGYGPPGPYPGYPPAYPGSYPGWGWPPPPAGQRRPGQVVTAAVLAFVQAALVLFASLYVYLFASLAEVLSAGSRPFDPGPAELATEGTILSLLQVVSAVVLVVGGVVVLNRRTHGAWVLLVVAHVLQVALAVYWAARLTGLVGDAPGSVGGALVGSALFFVAGPLVALGLTVAGPGRRWFTAVGDRAAA